MMNRMTRSSVLCVVVVVALSAATAYAQGVVNVDPALKPYAKVSGVSGNLDSIGADTFNNLMSLWARRVQKEVSGGQDTNRGQRIQYRPAGAYQGHCPARSHVANNERERTRSV